MSNPTPFEGAGEEFIGYYNTVRGYVRQEVARKQLVEHLPDQPAQILDIGGGDARNAIWLAARGHHVTVVEPDPDMLYAAGQSLARINPDISNKIELLGFDDTETANRFPEASFDVVLSHGVLMYQIDGDPQSHVDAIAKLLSSGGTLSLLTKGFAGAFLRLAQTGDIDAAEDLRQGYMVKNNLNKWVLALPPEEVQKMLKAAGLTLDSYYGVRVLTDTDNRKISEVGHNQLEALVDYEIEIGSRSDCRGIGQMIHYIARKP